MTKHHKCSCCPSALSPRRERLPVRASPFVALICIVSAAAGSEADSDRSAALCGPLSLLHVCQHFDVETTIGELAGMAQMTPSGTTLLGLCRAAQAKGLMAAGIKVDMAALKSFRDPVIAHVRGKHFVVVERYAGGRFRVYDPQRGFTDISEEELGKIWQGLVLVVQRPPGKRLSPGPRADIRFESVAVDLGKVEPGSILIHRFVFENAGQRDLVVEHIETQCRCSVAKTSSRRVAPGKRGFIEVRLDTRGYRGPVKQYIRVLTNDPEERAVTLTVTYRAVQAIEVLPERVVFGRVGLESLPRTRKIRVFDSGTGDLRVAAVESSSKHMTVRLLSKPGDRLHEPYEYMLSLGSGAPTGRFSGSIAFRTNSKDRPRIEVPVAADIVGPISMSPASVFFGIVSVGTEAKRVIELSSRLGKPFRVTEVRSSVKRLRVEARKTGGKWSVILDTGTDPPVGFFKGQVVIETDMPEQRETVLPVSGFVCSRRGVLP